MNEQTSSSVFKEAVPALDVVSSSRPSHHNANTQSCHFFDNLGCSSDAALLFTCGGLGELWGGRFANPILVQKHTYKLLIQRNRKSQLLYSYF